MTRSVLLALVAGSLALGCTSPREETTPAQPFGGVVPVESKDDFVRYLQSQGCYRPSAAALAVRPGPKAGQGTIRAPLVVQEGEIVVMEGTEASVSTMADGGYGIVVTQFVQNAPEITKALLKVLPDDFDAFAVFTTFPDKGSEDSVAWHLSVRQPVYGIGADVADSGPYWGSGSGGRLHGFINMQYVGKYGSGLEQPTHWIHQVLAHEFAHRWLVHARYTDLAGKTSEALLGRQKAHWANGVQADASVMDGYRWQDLGSGSFLMKGANEGFSLLDQYLMGLVAPEDVPDLFVVRNMVYKAKAVDPAAQLPFGIKVTGDREDVTMEMLQAAMGKRKPSHEEAPKDFRLALVLLTAPGETADKAKQFTEHLELFRLTFEQRVNEMAGGRLHLCTQVSAPCDAPGVSLGGFEVREHSGNGDGLIDPGDTVAIDVTVRSTGVGMAPDVHIELEEPNIPGLNIITAEIGLGDIPEGGEVVSAEPLLIKIPPTVGCGNEATVPLRLSTEDRTFPAQLSFLIGVDTVVMDQLESGEAWTIDPYGTDDAEDGVWEVGEPRGVDALYLGLDLVAQPSQDHSPDGVNALVTGREGGDIGELDVDGGVTTALSPEYDIGDARDPLLTWYSWHFAYDFNALGGAAPVSNDALVTEASSDGGATWTIIDVDASNEQQWVRKEIRLAEHLDLFSGMLQLRFSVTDDKYQSLLEAAIDDVRVWDESMICRPDLREPEPEPEPDSEPGPEQEPEPEPGPEQEPLPPVTGEQDGDGCSAAAGARGLGGLLLTGAFLLLLLALRRRRTVRVEGSHA